MMKKLKNQEENHKKGNSKSVHLNLRNSHKIQNITAQRLNPKQITRSKCLTHYINRQRRRIKIRLQMR